MAKLAVEKYPDCLVVYCDTMKSEHDDNERFFSEVQRWIEKRISVLQSAEFDSIEDVFSKTRYMSGPLGARCTVEMKKVPRFNFQQPGDVHLFGFSADEGRRIWDFEQRNPELKLEWILRDLQMNRGACLEMVKRAGIKLPAMYRLGYRNNNCLGCVKASSPRYWNMIRRDFPEVFKRRAEQSRGLGCRLVMMKSKRIFLDELPEGYNRGALENISCGPECGVQMPLAGVA